jgi:uncharacterized membrane protein YvbJ
MVNCKNCGQPLVDTMKFCHECGEPNIYVKAAIAKNDKTVVDLDDNRSIVSKIKGALKKFLILLTIIVLIIVALLIKLLAFGG